MSKRRRHSNPMTRLEKRAVFSLAGIFGLRIFGLFLILPVFALYATELEQATPFLIGLTLGAYGLTQAVLQIPFGVLSDRWDRKKAIILGLLIFALGSIIAGMAESIYGVLVGRLVQGAGAISAAVIALLADLTREEQRTKAMAVIGVGIGFVFMVSMILGPVFEQWVGVNGIFFLMSIASIIAIPVLLKITPTPKSLSRSQSARSIKNQMANVIRNPQLLQLDFGIFALHAVLTSIFVVIPFTLIDLGGLPKPEHWKIYSSVMVLGGVGMLPFLAVSHQREKIRIAMQLAVLILSLAILLMLFSVNASWWGLLFGLVLFFSGFNALEAMLPSLISRVAPIASKGSAMGVYNSAQFLGVFVGGAFSGWLSGWFGFQAVFVMCLIFSLLWLLVTLIAPALKLYDSKLVNLGQGDAKQLEAIARQLGKVRGVIEVSLISAEAVAYLKIDPDNVDAEKIEALTG
jgi:MFS family permease